MNSTREGGFEVERYELSESNAYRFALDRRTFTQIFGSGMVVAFSLSRLAAQESGRQGRRRGRQMPQEISAWLHIDEDGQVTVFTGKVEVGQEIRTSLTQAVAEELTVPTERIRLIMGDTSRTPYDMGTFGSRTTPTMSSQLRTVSAAAREMLLELAADRWGVPATRLKVEAGEIVDTADDRSTGFGKLTGGRKLLRTVSGDVDVSGAEAWTVMGEPVKKIAGQSFVTGQHRFTSDLVRDGMWFGKVVRPDAFRSTLVSYEAEAAQRMDGVVVVRDGNFLGVAADTLEKAEQAVATIRPEWKTEDQISESELFTHLETHPREASSGFSRSRRREQGSLAAGFAACDRELEARYTAAYIAHAPLEPRAALAEWESGGLNIWTGTQRPFGVRSEVAEAFHLDEGKVRVRVPDTGSAYGGKHTGEAAIEAARLAKAARRPVRLVWTRREEFTWAYFRPAGVARVRAGVRKDGTVTAWEFHNYNSGGSAIEDRYDIENAVTEFHAADYPLRQGSYRALAATFNHFARESHIDDLALAVRMDPLEFRLRNLKDERMRAVLSAAARRFGWAGKKRAGQKGYGIACGFEKGSYVANCVEISLDRRDRVGVNRVVTAFECGAIVNPDHLRGQVEGCIIMGLGGALFEAVQFEKGEIRNPRFSQYRVPRFRDVPALETVLVNRPDLPSAGAGETPIVTIAPAIGNALVRATGKRFRSLPMVPDRTQ